MLKNQSLLNILCLISDSTKIFKLALDFYEIIPNQLSSHRNLELVYLPYTLISYSLQSQREIINSALEKLNGNPPPSFADVPYSADTVSSFYVMQFTIDDKSW